MEGGISERREEWGDLGSSQKRRETGSGLKEEREVGEEEPVWRGGVGLHLGEHLPPGARTHAHAHTAPSGSL